VLRVRGCTLRTLYSVNSDEVASGQMLLITIAFDDVSSGALSSDSFLQTQFFRHILPDALSFK